MAQDRGGAEVELLPFQHSNVFEVSDLGNKSIGGDPSFQGYNVCRGCIGYYHLGYIKRLYYVKGLICGGLGSQPRRRGYYNIYYLPLSSRSGIISAPTANQVCRAAAHFLANHNRPLEVFALLPISKQTT